MSDHFPTVGIVGEGALVRMMREPALALGVEIVGITDNCSMVSLIGASMSSTQASTLELSGKTLHPNSLTMAFVQTWNQAHVLDASFEGFISVLVARSPHGQASAWSPTQISPGALTTVTPMTSLSLERMGQLQGVALNLAKQSNLIGVMEVEFVIRSGLIQPCKLSLGPSLHGSWTIEGARTSQFEQHLRAILDLPLGDPYLVAPIVVTGIYFGEANMYRPYLHLMARSPGLKFHQYLSGPGQVKGHVTAIGRDLIELQECVNHAVDYLSGVIDE
jgi:phosphoribosylaminoimidazole carboxylase (NCAIR synthetase)